MVTVRRIWKKSQVSNYNGILDIWDSGSHKYERWPDGTEHFWKIIERNEIDGEIEEVLKMMPAWESPSHVLFREQIPVLMQLLTHQQAETDQPSEFLAGGWKVSQEQLAEPPSKAREAYMGGNKKEPRAHSRHGSNHRPYTNKSVQGLQEHQGHQGAQGQQV